VIRPICWCGVTKGEKKRRKRTGALFTSAPFDCADKLAEKYCWLICYERKILFRLKKQAEKDGL
jgi:hypothetical protein